MTPSDLPETAPEPKAPSAAQPSTPPPAAAKPSAKAAPAAASAAATHVAFTVDVATGAVVRVEAVEPNGARHALSEEDTQKLAGTARETMEGIIERAFEAGIACVLGNDPDEAEDAEEDAPLTRLLLRPLIDHSAARRLMRRDVLDRAALASLIRHAHATEH
jgi:hypothetical protein